MGSRAGWWRLRPRGSNPKAALVAIMKDEGCYAGEWARYHRLLGFEPILVYDNGSADDTADVLAAAGAAVVPWPDRPGVVAQLAAYNDAPARLAADWIAFFDADEFLVLHRHDSVSAWLRTMPREAEAVALNWRIFGSGGAVRRSDAPVIERFTRAAVSDSPLHQTVKTIARRSALRRMDIHLAALASHRAGPGRRWGGHYVDGSGAPMAVEGRGKAARVDHSTAQLNHYVVKSREEFAIRAARGTASKRPGDPRKSNTHKTNPRFFPAHDRNEVEDRTALDCLARAERRAAAAQG